MDKENQEYLQNKCLFLFGEWLSWLTKQIGLPTKLCKMASPNHYQIIIITVHYKSLSLLFIINHYHYCSLSIIIITVHYQSLSSLFLIIIITVHYHYKTEHYPLKTLSELQIKIVHYHYQYNYWPWEQKLSKRIL